MCLSLNLDLFLIYLDELAESSEHMSCSWFLPRWWIPGKLTKSRESSNQPQLATQQLKGSGRPCSSLEALTGLADWNWIRRERAASYTSQSLFFGALWVLGQWHYLQMSLPYHPALAAIWPVQEEFTENLMTQD